MVEIIELDSRQHFSAFESAYIKLRKEEGRLLSLQEIKRLPNTSKSNPHRKEWHLRKRSTERLLTYVNKYRPYRVLDLGCGNGWLTYKLSRSCKDVLGLDVNKTELLQAQRLLAGKNATLILGDVFEWQPDKKIDLIIINAALQYFQNAHDLISKLVSLLSIDGEIHLLDSPIYQNGEAVKHAKMRSKNYFKNQNMSQMQEFYFHHSWEDLASFSYEILYSPDKIHHRLKRKIFGNDSPFPWIRIKK